MLILTREIDETIIIDSDIKITVMEIQNGQVRFGIDAPEEVKVYREEIYKRMQAEADSGKDAA
jgi:carbon storage regulator